MLGSDLDLVYARYDRQTLSQYCNQGKHNRTVADGWSGSILLSQSKYVPAGDEVER